MNFILASIGVFLVTILVLVVILLVAKNFLVASGNVKLTINGDKDMEVESGSTLLNTLAVNGVFLPSACGGKGSCGQCKCQVVEGNGRKGIRMYGYLQQERGYLYQGVQGAVAQGCAHGLYSGFIRTD